MIKVNDKVCLITGAASGIGLEIAKQFAQYGAKVIIADKNGEAAKKVADEFLARQEIAMAVTMDVTNEAEVDAAYEAVMQHFGQIDVVVSNAGIQIISPLMDFSVSDWDRLMDIHVKGGFLTARAAMRHMKNQAEGGSIIFIGSIHSVEASLNKSAYVTAKHGLVGLARAIAKEGAPYKIKANMVNPGFVKTPLVEKQIPEQAKALGISEEEVVKRVMLGHTVDGEFTTVEDVALAVLFFAGFPSLALTGQSLLVTHGWHME